jgi:threonylcarbamoyladenosine tRNA methylthiotransferase MtaB
MARFFVQNFGCRATQADGAALEAQLAARGLESALARPEADFVILNTCTVTASADEDVRQTVRRVHRENPQSRILVTGCYAQRAPEELAAMDGVEWVVGNSHKTEIAELRGRGFQPDSGGRYFAAHALTGGWAVDRTRPNLKIQTAATIAAVLHHSVCACCAAPRRASLNRSEPCAPL